MDIQWQASGDDQRIRIGRARFSAVALKDYWCPIIDVRGRLPGPTLCVMAGIHINEASSIDAALAVAQLFDPEQLHGRISVIPIVSTHNLYKYTLVTAPTHGRDLHWSYPGRIAGSFNEALAYALLFEWANDADVLLDLHGGDLDERMARYVVIQLTDDSTFNARAEALARCFDTTLVVTLEASPREEFGRCCTALARHRRLALVAEAGDQGSSDTAAVQWMGAALSNVARHLSMLDSPEDAARTQIYLDRYVWISAPSDGIVQREFEPAQWIEAGAPIGFMRDLYGRRTETIRAPANGVVLMQKTTQFASSGYWIGSMGIPRQT